MKPRSRIALVACFAIVIAGPAFGQQKAPSESQKKPAVDPNEKVCEDITPVGSRLATKRFCATRSEWEEKKRQDREATEKAQVMACMPNVPGCE
jgi:hypothetical protein